MNYNRHLFVSGDKKWRDAWGFPFKKQEGSVQWFHLAWEREFAGLCPLKFAFVSRKVIEKILIKYFCDAVEV